MLPDNLQLDPIRKFKKKFLAGFILYCWLWYTIFTSRLPHPLVQVERWERQYLSSTGEGKPARYQKMLDLAGWLKEHVPAEDSVAGPGTGLVHGDYRVDNLVFHPTEVSILALQVFVGSSDHLPRSYDLTSLF
jgi:hypothetical protein